MAVWFVTIFHLVWVRLLGTFLQVFVCMYVFIALGYTLAVEFLGHILPYVKHFKELKDSFPKHLSQFTFLPAICEELEFSISVPTHIIFFIIASSWEQSDISSSSRTAFPWWLMMLTIFTSGYWLFTYLLCRNVYYNPLPILVDLCIFVTDLYE